MATSNVKAKTPKGTTKAQAKVTRKTFEPLTVALAAITPETAIKVAKGYAAAIKAKERAEGTFLASASAAAKLVGMPINSKQYDRQIAPDVRKAFASKDLSHIAETTRASYRSRFKTFCLAINCGVSDLQPKAGESMHTYYARISVPLSTAKLPDGSPVWVSDGKAKAGRAAGTKVPKAGGANGKQFSGLSASDMADDEGGTNEAPMKAAARILARGNASRAARLFIVMQSYAEQFDRWASDILTDADKAELAKLTGEAVDAKPAALAVAKAASATGTALGDKLVAAQAKANAKANAKAA